MKKLLEKIKQTLSNESGFTMIELIIVIALIAIIGAMLVPNFAQTTARSRIKTDINGLKSIQSAINLYEAEMGATPTMPQLVSAKYLDATPTPQYSGATYTIDATNKVVVYTYTGTDYDTYISGLTGPFTVNISAKTVTAKK
jgi:prepilin-type N-terminal cleavage/methylation domain-containing protein